VPSTHTYRLLIVKDPVCRTRHSFLAGACCESFCSSAAEKRDYAVLAVMRQALRAVFFVASRPCRYCMPSC
ncbi:hypothetical protein, partial [Noviherbaspirillum aridicola]|uniref:hypothetical protein n=1 Tax=Noviherbaspirillum aridicola TaxID=2849687 RepID=UPI001C8114E8